MQRNKNNKIKTDEHIFYSPNDILCNLVGGLSDIPKQYYVEICTI